MSPLDEAATAAGPSQPASKGGYNFAYLDEQTKRMIRRALLKAVAIPGYQVPFGSREMPLPYGWGTGGIQVTASIIGPDDLLKVIDQGADDTTNAVSIRRFFRRTRADWEKLFEGVVMLTAAGLLTWMIFWMRNRARSIRREIEGRTQAALDAGSAVGLALVVFIGVGREGVETALFLFSSIEGSSPLISLVAALIGGVAAIALGYVFYRGSHRLNLRAFFTATSVLLLLFAGYLLASGLHELAEAGVFPESQALLVGAFVALAAPTMYFFFRRPKKT